MNQNQNQLYENVEDIHSRYTTQDFKNKNFLIIGGRCQGKTTLAKNIISIAKPKSVVISGAKDAKGELIDMFYTKLSPKKDLMGQINEIMNKKDRGHTLIWIRGIDLIDNKIFKTKTFEKLLFNSRSYNLSVIIEMQHSYSLGPELRTNFDYVFLAREDYINNQKKNFEYYLGLYPSYASYKKVNDSLKQYNFLMIKNFSSAQLVKERVSKIITKLSMPFTHLEVLDLPKEEMTVDFEKQNEIRELKKKVIDIRKELTKVIDRLETLEN